jgi:uncharacterized membrane protein YccC
MRATRAAIVVPAVFALTLKGIADMQMALFAAFGGFATLVIADFGGTRKDKLIAHASLAVTGSLALIIGTLVSGTAWLAAVVTIPVAFTIFFAGVIGPNAATGTTAAIFTYILPVASVGGASTIPSRLGGWWLASAAGAAAVLLFSPRTPSGGLRMAAATLAAELAIRVKAAANGEATAPDTMRQASAALQAAFTAAPYRPTGLATADQGLASVVQTLEWGNTQVSDAFDGHLDMTQACPPDRELLQAAGCLFHDISALMAGGDAEPDFEALEAARTASAAHLRELSPRAGEPDTRAAAAHAVHAQTIAVAARSAADDALVASRHANPETIVAERRQWYGTAGGAAAALGLLPGSIADSTRLGGLVGATVVVARHATIRSVRFISSLRGALALAAAVAVADLSGAQHGFWVVLGTLSVLRTNAASTGAAAWRALAGTGAGFVVGALLLLAIGTGQTALWVALPVAVFVEGYAPGTLPFVAGQAAFTVTVVVLFNLLIPVGWKVGLLRVEDVAAGCAVSLIVGVLFWPRGAGSVVSDDLADSFRRGAEYLTQAVDWALSELMAPPSAAIAAVAAGIRLDDALRGFLAEQGSKRISKEDLWTLVNASVQLRLTANTLAGLRRAEPGARDGLACRPLKGSGDHAETPACAALRSAAAGLAGFYGQVADEVGHTGRPDTLTPIPAPAPLGPAVPPPDGAARAPGSPGQPGSADSPDDPIPLSHTHLLWVKEHLHYLGQSAQAISEPALRLAEARHRPWWR